MDFKELWIGDEVYIKSKGINGKWDGMSSPGFGRVKWLDTLLVLPLTDLDEAKAILVKEEVIEKKPKFTAIKFIPTVLDLHMEKLNPSLLHQAPELILGHQLRRCKSFVEDAIKFRKVQVTIIHGKGTGALKTEVHNLLNGMSNISNLLDKNDGGATEVWFYN